MRLGSGPVPFRWIYAAPRVRSRLPEKSTVRVCWLVFRLPESGVMGWWQIPQFATYEDISRTFARFAFSRRVFLREFRSTMEYFDINKKYASG
jgi:hypothetical protein